MHYALSPDVHPAVELTIPANLGGYRQRLPIFGIDMTVLGPTTCEAYVFDFKLGSFADKSQLELMLGMTAWKQASANERWRRYVVDPRASANVDALTETVEGVLDFIGEFGPGTLALGGLRSDTVHCEHLAALLRATSTWRDEIPGWSNALDVTRAAVESAGLDPEDVLFGMV